MAEHDGEHGHGHDDHGVGHVAPTKALVGTGVALLVLTGATVWTATQIDLGEANIYIALFIAVLKAALVMLFFMHLWWDRPFNAIVCIGSIAFVALFLGLAMTDTAEYQSDIIPGDGPAVVNFVPTNPNESACRTGMNAPITAAKSPFDDVAASSTARRFGMVLFLISLGVLFAATIVAFAVVRWQLERDGLWPADLPRLPHAVWASTVLLIVSGLTMHLAIRGVRAGDTGRLRLALNATTALGIAFLVVQAGCWWLWHGAVGAYGDQSDGFRLAITGFYVLSGLHGLHVVGGIVGLLFTSNRAARGRYTPEHYTGVRACAMYWHFLDAVWLILFGLLLVGA